MTTKVWVTDQKTEESAYQAVKTSLAKLNLPYVDLILLHQPMGDYFAAYRSIAKCVPGRPDESDWRGEFLSGDSGEPLRKRGSDSGGQSGGVAPVFRAGGRAGNHEGIRRRAADVGGRCRKATTEFSQTRNSWKLESGAARARRRSFSAGTRNAAFRLFRSPSTWSG